MGRIMFGIRTHFSGIFIIMLLLVAAADAQSRVRRSLLLDGANPITTGRIVGLTIIVDFRDEKAVNTPSQVNDLFNRVGGMEGRASSGSVYDYFLAASNGALEFTNIIAPVITLPRDKSHYDREGKREYVQELITDALKELDKRNFNLRGVTLDTSGNRQTAVALNILYAGNPSHGWAQGLWPHAGTYRGGATINGIHFRRYQITNLGEVDEITLEVERGLSRREQRQRIEELKAAGPTNCKLHNRLGTLVHEVGHMLLRWPDLYSYEKHRATTSAAGTEHVGRWCIMSSGNRAFPQLPNPYFRFISGWLDAKTLNGVPAGTVLSLNANAPEAYVYWRSTQEAYFIEARRRVASGPDREEIPGSGLAIWHIHTDGSNTFSDSVGFPIATIIQADGKRDIQKGVNRGDATDLFNLNTQRQFNNEQNPSAIYHDGALSGICISDISDTGAVMTFKVCNDFFAAITPNYAFNSQVAAYATNSGNTTVLLTQNLTLDDVFNIRKPNADGSTLTIRSANPFRPNTLTRGKEADGDLFTVNTGTTLILENVIIDGGGESGRGRRKSADSNGTLVRINYDGEFVMKRGAVLQNNRAAATTGGAVHIRNGTFTMRGGNIRDNYSSTTGGAVYIHDGVFIMRGGRIRNNTAATRGGGVHIREGDFIMRNGRIRNNTATESGGGVSVANGAFTMRGGKVKRNTAKNDENIQASRNARVRDETISGREGSMLYPNLKLDFPLLEFPYQTDAANRPDRNFWNGYLSPSMNQSLLLVGNLHSLFSSGMQVFIDSEKEQSAHRITSLVGNLLLSQVGGLWLHEEYRRAILSRHGINSSAHYHFLRNKSYVSVANDSEERFALLKQENPVEFTRLAIAGLESNNLLINNLQNKVFFYDQKHDYMGAYLGYTLNSHAYIFAAAANNSAFSENPTIGYDMRNWANSLFRLDPNEENNDLSDKIDSYINSQRFWHFLNYASPMVFGIQRLQLGNLHGNIALRHTLNPFGTTLSAQAFLKYKRLNGSGTHHIHLNNERAFLGWEFEVVDLPIAFGDIQMLLSPRVMFGAQPQDLDFRTDEAQGFGLGGLRVSFPISRHFLPYIDFSIKSDGWVAGNEYLNGGANVKMGTSLRF